MKRNTMDASEEYKWISNTFKGEPWEYSKHSLIEEFDFTEVEGQHFKSPNTGIVYRFVLKRDTELFITRIEVFENNKYSSLEYSVSNRISLLQQIDDKKRIHKEVMLEMQAEREFQIRLDSSVAIINSYWTYSQRQNGKYRKNKDSIDNTIKCFNDIGFDFSRSISVLDALMVEDDYCVIEFRKRANNKNLLKTIQAGEKYVYLYKAKPDDAFMCLYSGILVQNMFGMDLFIQLHINNED